MNRVEVESAEVGVRPLATEHHLETLIGNAREEEREGQSHTRLSDFSITAYESARNNAERHRRVEYRGSYPGPGVRNVLPAVRPVNPEMIRYGLIERGEQADAATKASGSYQRIA
jgi:hypothetical protein